MTNIAGALAGLGLLTGTDAFATLGTAATVETRAQRRAKAAFTTPASTPPWKAAASSASLVAQAATIKAMKTIVDTATTGSTAPTADVQTSFTTYKALDRLRVLAETASKDTTSSAERTALSKSFAKGMADLKTYLASAPSDLVDISFAKSARQALTVGIASPSSLTAAQIAGTGVRATRDGALDGVTGSETLRITLSKPGGVADDLTVDLSNAPQPPTLDGVADAINAAIAAVPQRDAAGQVVRDADGASVPRWSVKFVPGKTGDKWGLAIDRAGFETVSIDEVGAPDALMVAATSAVAGTPAATRITRFDDIADALDRTTRASLDAVDRGATERLAAAADADKTGKTKATTVAAATTANGIAGDADGNSYVVGTTAGDVGANLSHGADDLTLTKLDSEGQVVWRRGLGAAGSAQGAAVTIAPDGGIVVAGTVTGAFDGATSDGDMMVAKFDPRGEEQFSTLVRAIGAQSASAVAVAADGSLFVGGTDGDGKASIARLDAGGTLVERRVLQTAGTATVKALAIGVDGALLALTGEGGTARLRRIDAQALSNDRATLDLGQADARTLAVAADGRIAVAGATDAALPGTQANAASNSGRDGFVARIDAGLGSASITYLASAGEDQVDSIAWAGDTLYAGGRTAGTLGTAKTGVVDAFVARIDGASGLPETTRQFGLAGETIGPVRLATVAGGDDVLGALGLHRGTLTPTDSVSLEAQTSLRVGDSFALKVNGGSTRKIVVAAGDTLTTLADRIRSVVGTRVASVTTPLRDGGRALRIDMLPGNEMELIAGSAGSDALAKLGLSARRIATPATVADDAPKVRPGGSFALDLSEALRLDTRSEAADTLATVKQAISFAQSAYRSLYWDDTKAQLADSVGSKGRKAGSTAIEKGQLANYQAALTRLSGTSTTTYTGL